MGEQSKRCAVITGGSRGIGRAIAVKLASQGYHVVIGYAGNADKAKETEELCVLEAGNNGFEIKALTVQGDVGTSDGVKNLIQTATNVFGRIDVLVNNAGITRDNLLARMTADEFDQVIASNLRGTFLCCQAVTRIMMKQRFGRIVNISSIVGIHGNAGQVNYSASKAGIIGITKSVAMELASRNITCNAIAPGFIDTEMTQAMSDTARDATLSRIPMRKVGDPMDVANLVSFLVSNEASYITGQVIGVDGGMGC